MPSSRRSAFGQPSDGELQRGTREERDAHHRLELAPPAGVRGGRSISTRWA
jgi:hypothetical protein